MKRALALVVLALSCAMVAASSRTLRAEEKETVHSIELPTIVFDLAEGPNRDQTMVYCAVCHAVDYIPMQPKLSRAQWTATVTKMIKAYGAPIPQEDADRIVDYLCAAYGTGN